MPLVGNRAKATDFTGEGQFKNLKITNNITNPDYQIDVTADVAHLSSSDTPPKVVRFRNVSVTIDITTVASDGTSGLDTGSEDADEMYAIWYSGKSDGSTLIGEFSTSFSAPTTPTDYDYTLLVGGIRSGWTNANLDPQGNSDFARIYQVGNYVQCMDSHRILAPVDLTTSNWTAVDLSDVLGGAEEIVPLSICNLVEITSYVVFDTNSEFLYLSGDPNRVDAAGGIITGEVTSSSVRSLTKSIVPITSSNIYYRANDVTGSPTSEVTLYVTGYYLSI